METYQIEGKSMPLIYLKEEYMKIHNTMIVTLLVNENDQSIKERAQA
jgi:hypothetical protein